VESLPSAGVYPYFQQLALQFGFITLFASALPLAPLLAAVCNALELRLEAFTICRVRRRPMVGVRPDIGGAGGLFRDQNRSRG
jgi:hypothetical protein